MTAPDRRSAESLLGLVGGTPLVRLARAAPAAEVHAKLEYLNPGGSVKDRAALAMVLDAEESGALRPGGTVVEGTSGNTGLGLAQVAAARGYRSLFVLPDKTAVEKLDALRAYGAEVVLTPSALPREHPDHVINYATRLAKETDGGWLADQYGNPANPEIHRRTTGPEIWEATGGRITHLVSTIGTGGTITGTGSYLREVSGGRVEIVGADPVTSRYGGGDGSPFAVEAAGHYLHPETAEDVFPDVYRREVVDRIETIGDRESILTARGLARTEGLLVGGSSGTAAAAALRVAREAGPDAVVVAILPDSGRAYLSKYHSETWLRRQGFLDDDRPGTLAPLVSPVVSVPTGTSVGEARAALEASGQAALPVVLAGRSDRFPPAAGEVLALLSMSDLRGVSSEPVPVPATPPVGVGTGETAAEALARLGPDVEAVHLVRDARLAGVLSLGALRAREH
ncbi:PLP-dependent cysteine synthase family protein [Actinomycetospora sp. TBRC 11914]|uniref:PLP-dependent cysteine synthase family protein n=1 Tax=Actinomycetospora sp. TBRC 11914 TaxID=2729387 RepID=UPI00145DC7B0|nr:pyridoxal-phosphate dependent enzyme [Actinomycetospora sp. TBRC 11914]NMO91526.1 pyridoxal-phosphate dependent enzyme [Actinomycetospora sp. TBRC 11914]